MRMQDFLSNVIFHQIYENLPISVEVVDDLLRILFEDGMSH